MKKIVKIFSIIALVLIVISTIGSIALATTTPSSISISQPDDEGLVTTGGKVIGLLQVFGVVIAVLILVVLGIKYMMASPEGKADYKSSAIPYIVGAVLIFGATQIAGFVYNAVNQ